MLKFPQCLEINILQSRNMEIFAHRGLLNKFPENSIAALVEAFKLGFGVETDLRLTRDNDFIVIHDDNFKRLTGKDLAVKDLTEAEAREPNYFNSKEKIISLKELLIEYQKHKFNEPLAIHLKADSQTKQGLNLIAEFWQKYNLYRRAFVFDLSLKSLKLIKEIDKNIDVALIISENKFDTNVCLWNDVKNEDFEVVWAAEWRSFYSQGLINKVKSSKRKIYAMSPDVHRVLGHPLAHQGYEKTWQNLIKWEVDGICTDYPDKLHTYCQKNIFELQNIK